MQHKRKSCQVHDKNDKNIFDYYFYFYIIIYSIFVSVILKINHLTMIYKDDKVIYSFNFAINAVKNHNHRQK